MKFAQAISETPITRISNDGVEDLNDVLAIEEPLEIRIGFSDGTHKAVSITMRSPGEDSELAVGFLFTEGIISSPEQVKHVRHCGSKTANAPSNSNTIRVDLADGVDIDLKRLERNFYTTSSCGGGFYSSVEATLTQFPTIKKVVYAVEENTNDFYEWVQVGECPHGKRRCARSNFQ